VEPAKILLDDDGLPPDPEISLVEAWSWCAFGRALPHTVWIDATEIEGADSEFVRARKNSAHFLARFRRARWDFRRLDPRSASPMDSTYTVDVVHRASATTAHSALEDMRSSQHKLRGLVAKWKLIQEVYENFCARRGVSESDTDLVTRAAQEADRRLIRAFLAGDLQCLGRLGRDTGQWQSLPRDCFRWPVQIRVNHNILEPAGNASVDQHKAIAKHVSVWVDLRVSTSTLKEWWLGAAAKAEEKELADGEILAWAKPIMNRIASAGRQLRRGQFERMLEEKFGSRLPAKVAERLWLLAAPEPWRKPSQGRLGAAASVIDWREYETP
jgi:hypothetical protein